MHEGPRSYQIGDRFRLIPTIAELPDDCGWNEGLRSEQLAPGWVVNLFDFIPRQDVELSISGPATFSISIFVGGRGRLALDDGPVLEMQPGTMVLFHAPHPTRGLNHVYGGTRVLGLDFRFSPELLNEIGVQCLAPLVRGFSENCSVQDALLLGRPLTGTLRSIAADVLGCTMRGEARRLYLQAKALELLAYVVALTDGTESRSAGLSRRDRERVQAAAQSLSERFSEPWTIASLARTVGLNERKLKAGFRTLLGRTVHSYLEEVRLDAARRLMSEREADVTQAALAVGYANPSHFAKLFKRRVGLSPGAWRRQNAGS
jgi:AraC-like DNA-binding protein